jgi:hypothetical protein
MQIYDVWNQKEKNIFCIDTYIFFYQQSLK